MGRVELRIEIDAELVSKARAAGVLLDDAAEVGLRLAVANAGQERSAGVVASHLRQISDPAGATARARQWAIENAAAIAIHNERIAARGLFGEDLRRW